MSTIRERIQNALVSSLGYFFKKDDLASPPKKEIKGISQPKVFELLQDAGKSYKEIKATRLSERSEVAVEVKAKKKLVAVEPEVTVAEKPKSPTQEIGG